MKRSEHSSPAIAYIFACVFIISTGGLFQVYGGIHLWTTVNLKTANHMMMMVE